MILRCKNIPEVKELLHTVPHASGMNYTVASSSDWTSLECSANKVCECITSEMKYFCHTNHPLKNDDLVCAKPHISDSSKNRLKFLEEKLANIKPEDVTEQHLKEWLGRAPVCIFEEHNTGFTFGSIIAVLTEEPVLYISPGPPSITPWVRLDVGQ